MRKFVLDTSLFINPQARDFFGKDPVKAVTGFIKKSKKIDAEFYIPPSILQELSNFCGPATVNSLEMVVKKRAPNIYAIYLPAAVFYDFIEEVRERINKGLRLAEEFAKDNRPENEEKLRKLREKYREMMRTGIVDSKEDFEIILLAKELNATIVSSDEGVQKFANKVGCEWIDGSQFAKLFQKKK